MLTASGYPNVLWAGDFNLTARDPPLTLTDSWCAACTVCLYPAACRRAVWCVAAWRTKVRDLHTLRCWMCSRQSCLSKPCIVCVQNVCACMTCAYHVRHLFRGRCDVWADLKSGDPGLTYDGKTNAMLGPGNNIRCLCDAGCAPSTVVVQCSCAESAATKQMSKWQSPPAACQRHVHATAATCPDLQVQEQHVPSLMSGFA